MKDFYTRYRPLFGVLFLVWFIILHLLTLIPDFQVPERETRYEFLRADYLFHFAAYFVLSLLFVCWYHNPHVRGKLPVNLVFVLAGVFLAMSVEVLQIWIPGRSFNTWDLLYGSAGVFTGYPGSIFLLGKVFMKKG